jgi:hypothetical protein
MLLEFFTDIYSSKLKFDFSKYDEIKFRLFLPVYGSYENLYYQFNTYTSIDSNNDFIVYSKFRIYNYYKPTHSLIKISSYFRITDEKGESYIIDNSIEFQ